MLGFFYFFFHLYVSICTELSFVSGVVLTKKGLGASTSPVDSRLATEEEDAAAEVELVQMLAAKSTAVAATAAAGSTGR